MTPPVQRVSKILNDGKEAPLRTFRHWADFHRRSISGEMSDLWPRFFSLFWARPRRDTLTMALLFFFLTNLLSAECRGAVELWALTKPVWWCPTTGVGVTINTADAAWCMTPIMKADASFHLYYGRGGNKRILNAKRAQAERREEEAARCCLMNVSMRLLVIVLFKLHFVLCLYRRCFSFLFIISM